MTAPSEWATTAWHTHIDSTCPHVEGNISSVCCDDCGALALDAARAQENEAIQREITRLGDEADIDMTCGGIILDAIRARMETEEKNDDE